MSFLSPPAPTPPPAVNIPAPAPPQSQPGTKPGKKPQANPTIIGGLTSQPLTLMGPGSLGTGTGNKFLGG